MQNRARFTNPVSESIANYGTRSKIEFYQYFTLAGKKHRGCGGQNHHVRGQLSELPVSADKEGGPETQAPAPDFSCTTARAQTRTHTDSHALRLWILNSTCQTGDMGPSRSTPRSACASTHPRSRRSSPPPPSPLHLDSKHAAGRRHGGATPPR